MAITARLPRLFPNPRSLSLDVFASSVSTRQTSPATHLSLSAGLPHTLPASSFPFTSIALHDVHLPHFTDFIQFLSEPGDVTDISYRNVTWDLIASHPMHGDPDAAITRSLERHHIPPSLTFVFAEDPDSNASRVPYPLWPLLAPRKLRSKRRRSGHNTTLAVQTRESRHCRRLVSPSESRALYQVIRGILLSRSKHRAPVAKGDMFFSRGDILDVPPHDNGTVRKYSMDRAYRIETNRRHVLVLYFGS